MPAFYYAHKRTFKCPNSKYKLKFFEQGINRWRMETQPCGRAEGKN